VSDYFPGTPDDPPPDFDPVPGQDPPPSDFDDPSGSTSCTSICNELVNTCPDEDTTLDDCIAECRAEIPSACFGAAVAVVRCLAQNGCMFDEQDQQQEVCEAELLRYIECLGPEPPDGEGGAGNQ
jgi:hypothetical protein